MGGLTAVKLAARKPAVAHTDCAWVTEIFGLFTSWGTVQFVCGVAVGVGLPVEDGVPTGVPTGVGDGVGEADGEGLGVAVVCGALLTVMVVVAHAPTRPAGRLCHVIC